jgi:hypothetical protein
VLLLIIFLKRREKCLKEEKCGLESGLQEEKGADGKL